MGPVLNRSRHTGQTRKCPGKGRAAGKWLWRAWWSDSTSFNEFLFPISLLELVLVFATTTLDCYRAASALAWLLIASILLIYIACRLLPRVSVDCFVLSICCMTTLLLFCFPFHPLLLQILSHCKAGASGLHGPQGLVLSQTGPPWKELGNHNLE